MANAYGSSFSAGPPVRGIRQNGPVLGKLKAAPQKIKGAPKLPKQTTKKFSQ